MQSTVLVIGSSGFIGTHLTALLADRGHDVVGLDVKPPRGRHGVDRFVQGDVRNTDDLRRAMEGVDVVFNLAAIHFDFGHEREEYFDTNENGMSVLLDVMSEMDVQQLVFTSSIAVYGDRSDEPDEETPPAPTSAYGESKLAAERRIDPWLAENPERCVTIIRPCAVYGERNISNMMNLIRQIHSGYFMVFGTGENSKATAYVGNLVDAIYLQYELLQPGLQVFNYADKPDLSVNQIVRIIRTALGKSPTSLRMPLWLGVCASIPFEIVSRITGRNFPVSMARVKKLAQPTRVSATRIREAGFQQRVDSEEGLRRMVTHFLATKSGGPNPVATETPSAHDNQRAETAS